MHPDKCSHPRAGDAFDILGQAQQTLLEDDRFKELQYIVNMARGGCRPCQARLSLKSNLGCC